MSIVPVQLVTNALIALLKSQAGWSVHDHPYIVEKPTYPYLAVFQLPGGRFSGPPLTAPDADAELLFQLDAIGRRRDQAQLQGDKACALLIGREADGSYTHDFGAVEGWKVTGRMPADTTPGGVETIQATPTLYRDTRRYTIALTPQGT